MEIQTLRRIGWIGASLGLTSLLVGCKDMPADSTDVAGSTSSSNYITDDNGLQGLNGLGGLNGLNSQNGIHALNGLNSQNGLNAQNGFTGQNGLNSQNGLNGQNGLGSINGYPGMNGFNGQNGFNVMNGFNAQNGLGSINGVNLAAGMASQNGIGENAGLMTSDSGREVVKYLAKCALGANDTLVKKDQSGTSYTFAGSLGLAPQWKDSVTGSCNQACTEAMSACMMAHINTSGVHIPLWMVGPESSVGWGQSPWFPTREGTFFGQMMLVDVNNNLDAYYCNGPGSDKNVVPGRLGFNQGAVPYQNAWPASAGMDGMCDTSHSTGTCTKHALSTGETTTDGPDSCTLNGVTYNNPLTVWRGETFQAEAAEGGVWYNYNTNSTCQSGQSGCAWYPNLFGFGASNCNQATSPVGTCANIQDPKNGMGARVGNIGPSKGVHFKNVNVACGGSNTLVVFTTNGMPIGDMSRHLNFVVNGGSPQNVAFAGAGDWSNPVGANVPLSGFNQGTKNDIFITGDPTNPAPDLDWIEIINSNTTCTTTAKTCAVGTTVSIQSMENSMFASARSDNNLNVMAEASVASTWEQFDIVDGGSGFVALKSHMNNEYVSADLAVSSSGPLRARSTSIGPWEQFTFVKQANGYYALKANANGHYVSARVDQTNSPLQASASTPNTWEYFSCQ
jgi:hypothetical protein